ncbi:MAG: hypothetical protein CO126_07480 [Hydrogenophilales bacterium CG_4_9_14_3_um_filter_63_34]|nr:MAG: hypothetical protein COZ24_08770 [Hydrogenophilales bacterium CG_4_10_14_3_um_filter_63_21]PJB03302.1 MAG: hypothetical protein CO126_07480 [Hydrogenophilales bacterium CG_4_9_14_3_um_filter_63_34]
MKSGTMLKALGVCAISFLSLSGGAAQAADSCVLSALSRPAASVEGANGSGDCRVGNRSNASARDQDKVATLAPLVGGMAKEGIQTASSVMRALTHEASRFIQE